MSSQTDLKLCPVAALTAAYQDVVPRERFSSDPIGAAMDSALEWIRIAKECQLDGLELAAALAPSDSYIPAEQMLDPVAAHLAARTKPDGSGEDLSESNAARLNEACGDAVKINSLGAFENLLHQNPRIRAQVQAHTLRVARAAKLLTPVGCQAVTGFVGRDRTKSVQANLSLVRSELVPLWRKMQELGVKFRIENCPMPGWNDDDIFEHNIASTPAAWVSIFDIAKDEGVLDVLELNYDPSHDILVHNRPERSLRALAAAGYGDKVGSLHVKDQHQNAAAIALHGGRGQLIGQEHPWAVMIAAHGMPGLCEHNPLALYQGQQVDFIGQQIVLRQIVPDVTKVVCIIEHEWIANRVQDRQRVVDMYRLSAQAMRAFDTIAAVCVQGKEWARGLGISLPGVPNPLLAEDPALAQAVSQMRAQLA